LAEGTEKIVEKDAKKNNKTGKPVDIGDLLFKSQFEDIVFDATQIFQEKAISMSVCSSNKSEVFQMTPKKLYAEIKTLAQSRYKYSLLPNKIQ